MWFYIKLARRNIFRNKRRTIIASTAIGIALACLIFFDAMLLGMASNMIKSATDSFLGQAQIHGQEFRSTQDAVIIIKNLDQVESSLKQERIVKAFTLRTLSLGMITSPANVHSVEVIGINPGTEKDISKISNALHDGVFFAGDNLQDIVIGSELADIMEVSIGDRVVITLSQTGSGDLAQDLFRVSGIYSFGIKELDNNMAFIRINKAQEMLGIIGGVNEIAIKFTDLHYASQEDLFFWKKYSQFGNEAVSWGVLLPQLKATFEMTGAFRSVMSMILIFIVVFGIINTLFMSFYERMFELGVLRAVGTRPFGVVKLLLCEAGALGVLSIIIGVSLGLVITGIVAITGIDYRGIEFAGTVFQDLLYPVMKLYQFIVYPIGLFVFVILVGLYPAIVAARMSVSEAIRKSL